MQDFLDLLFQIYLPMGFGYLLGRMDFKKKKKYEILGEDFLRAEKRKNGRL